jgi:CheY-like chemotaxis protein
MSTNPVLAKTQTRRLLVVDDDDALLALIGKVLQFAAYDVRLANSGQMAVGILAEGTWRPDLALLDVQMPTMDGLELAALLRNDWNIPAMFLTGSDDQSIVRQATDDGAVGYLLKPFNAANIVPAVQAALARSAEILELRDSESKLTRALLAGRETGMAVGLLMERHGINRDRAFDILRDHARSNNRKLNEVAQQLLSATELLNAPMIEWRAKKLI